MMCMKSLNENSFFFDVSFSTSNLVEVNGKLFIDISIHYLNIDFQTACNLISLVNDAG